MNVRQWRSIAGVIVPLLVIGAAEMSAQTPWQATYPQSGWSSGRSVVILDDNSIVVAGETAPTETASTDLYLVKTDGCGRVLWGYSYDIGGNDHATKIRRTSDGGFIVVGTTENRNVEGGTARNDIFLLKVGATGVVQWGEVHGGEGVDDARDLQVVGDGYIVAGSTESFGSGSADAYLIRTDLEGNPIWARAYGGTGYDFLTSCTVAANGDIIAVGTKNISLFRQDGQGRSGCNDRIPDLVINHVQPRSAEMPNATSVAAQRNISTSVSRSAKATLANFLCTTCDPGPISSVDMRGAGERGELNLYPNPITAERTLVLEYRPGSGAGMALTVTDITGRIVPSEARSMTPGRLEIDTHGWPAGTYILRLMIGDRRETRKVTLLGD